VQSSPGSAIRLLLGVSLLRVLLVSLLLLGVLLVTLLLRIGLLRVRLLLWVLLSGIAAKLLLLWIALLGVRLLLLISAILCLLRVLLAAATTEKTTCASEARAGTSEATSESADCSRRKKSVETLAWLEFASKLTRLKHVFQRRSRKGRRGRRSINVRSLSCLRISFFALSTALSCCRGSSCRSLRSR